MEQGNVSYKLGNVLRKPGNVSSKLGNVLGTWKRFAQTRKRSLNLETFPKLETFDLETFRTN